MSNPLLAAVALAALAAASPAAAQLRQVSPQTVRPAQPLTPALRQPSNLELQMQINQLTETVAQLSDRLAALNQHIASISGQLGTLNARELNHARRIYATAYETCRLLYLHHWAPNGAHPTPGNPMSRTNIALPRVGRTNWESSASRGGGGGGGGSEAVAHIQDDELAG